MATKVKNRISENGVAEPDAEIVQLKPLVIKEFEIPIVGTSPLIVHKFSEKAKKAIEDKQGQKAKGGKEKRDPKSEYLAAMYVMPGTGKPGEKKTKYGVPAAGLKRAAVSACRFVDGMQMTVVRGAFHVLEDAAGLVQIHHDKKSPYMREDTVRLSGPGNALDLRYRPCFNEWGLIARIRYNATVISPEQIVNLFSNAGFGVGLCEWRAEKDGGYGQFAVKAA